MQRVRAKIGLVLYSYNLHIIILPTYLHLRNPKIKF